MSFSVPLSLRTFFNTGIKSFNFLCGQQHNNYCGTESEHQLSNGSLIGLLFPSSSCLLLHEDWNSVPNNINIRVKEMKIRLPFKIILVLTFCPTMYYVPNKGN